MLSAMIDRGPYLRFVWTLCADDLLDHHPDQRARRSWGDAERGWLRIERQVTVGFPAVRASLFLIRTYLRPFDSLESGERSTLRAAIAAMPEALRRYKGILGCEQSVLSLLGGSGPSASSV